MMVFGQYNLSGQNENTAMSGFDIWVQGKWAHSKSSSQKTDLGLLYTGVEYKFSSRFLIGIMGQMDWSDSKDGVQNTTVDGKGWMVGPYMVSRLLDNLLFDGRLAWGHSSNHVNPLGFFKDGFKTSRWLARGQLTGDFAYENWRFLPHIGVIYFEKRQKAYTDSLGISIPAQTVSLGRMTFGPKVSCSFRTEDGMVLKPLMGIKGIWNFKKADIVDLDTGAVTNSGDNLHARVEGGLSVRFSNGWAIGGEAFYDGIGVNHFQAYGGNAKLVIPLN